ncbi:MAG: hypothetical protein CMN04_01840 [Roseibacillus sp.]|nr:hypothetical protein [Roseibacillus sp.]
MVYRLVSFVVARKPPLGASFNAQISLMEKKAINSLRGGSTTKDLRSNKPELLGSAAHDKVMSLSSCFAQLRAILTG